jgi:hypothetical protein
MLVSTLLGASPLLAGCPADVPPPTQKDGRLADQGGADGGDFDGKTTDQSRVCSPSWSLPEVNGNNPACQPLATDYLPGKPDTWDPCISDSDPSKYVPFNTSISSIARVAAFESMMSRLLKAQPPSPDDFIAAKVDYTQPEGLDSRVSIREDEHYPPAAKKCADMTPAELQQNADRCVGGARMQPLINQAFVEGAAGKDPLLNAARIESTLLWFLYISVYKEATTCTNKSQDCDSSYAYYTGGESRSGGKGLARYVRGLSSQAHDRIFDGILAVRCWRDLDPGTPATNLALRDKATAQMDRGLHRGMALITRSRLEAVEAACGKPREALWASVQILGGALEREARARDATRAQTLRTELARPDPAGADLDLLDRTLEEIFPCP